MQHRALRAWNCATRLLPAPVEVLKLALLLVALSQVLPGAQSIALVPGTRPKFLAIATADDTGDSEFAVRQNTVIAGELLVEGPSNLQQDVEACAHSCNLHLALEQEHGHPGCNAFNFCPLEGGCIYDTEDTHFRAPQGSCQLLLAATAVDKGVFALGIDVEEMGSAGLRLQVNDTGDLAGYTHFKARSFLGQYDLQCQNTTSPGKCVLPGSLQDAAARCDAWPECQAFVIAPLGTQDDPRPVAAFKGSGDGSQINMARSNLAAAAAVYVKLGQLAAGGDLAGDSGEGIVGGSSSGEEENASGLSAGAIAGIVIGAACAGAALAAGAALLWHQQRRRPRDVGQGSASQDKGSEGTEGTQTSGTQSRSQSGVPSRASAGCPRATWDSLGAEGLSDTDLEAGEHKPLQGAQSNGSGRSSGSTAEAEAEQEFNLLVEEAMAPQWSDVAIPRKCVKLCRDGNGALVKLGGGASGKVYRGVIHGATTCACKVFELRNGMPGASTVKEFLQEVCMLHRLNHPHVVQFLGAAVSSADGQGLLCMEFMSGGDLKSLMRKELPDGRGRIFAWSNRGRRLATQIVAGLAYLHRNRIAHLDLKPGNVLLSREGNAKLGDVGFSRIMHHDFLSMSLTGRRLGTFNWAAPEVLLGEPATVQADIYSYGILLWELCTGEAPNRGTLRALTPADCPQEVAALQQQCMQREPHLRPSAAQILEILGSLESTEPQPQQLPAQHGSPAPKPLPPQPTAGAATPGAAAAPAHGATTAPLRRCVRFPPACSSPSPLFVASACSSVGAASKASSQTSQKVEEDEEDSSEEEEAINNSVGLVCTATS